jgi:hypothetical protein
MDRGIGAGRMLSLRADSIMSMVFYTPFNVMIQQQGSRSSDVSARSARAIDAGPPRCLRGI